MILYPQPEPANNNITATDVDDEKISKEVQELFELYKGWNPSSSKGSNEYNDSNVSTNDIIQNETRLYQIYNAFVAAGYAIIEKLALFKTKMLPTASNLILKASTATTMI